MTRSRRCRAAAVVLPLLVTAAPSCSAAHKPPATRGSIANSTPTFSTLAPAPSTRPKTTPERESEAPAPTPPSTVADLFRFLAALRALQSGERKDHVRIAWLGDSHTAADFWTGAVRRGLQQRFGNGGLGFVHMGWKFPPYRHDSVRLLTIARWAVAPQAYAQTKRIDDGVFGLGGVRFAPVDPESHAVLELTDTSLPGTTLTWDLAFRFAENGSSLHVSASDHQGHTAQFATASTVADPLIRHLVLTTAGTTGNLQVGGDRHTQFFGVTVESDQPGVVLDTLGLIGARLATFLAWEETQWATELTRRNPDLVVIAFGTNESADPARSSIERYGRHLEELVHRIRIAAPQSECLVITPIDRTNPQAQERLAGIRRTLENAATRIGCAVWSAFGAMGGAGSMAAWHRESPARASADGIHLTAKGYQALGDQLVRDITEAIAKLP